MIECIVRTDDLMAEVRVIESLVADSLSARAASGQAWSEEIASLSAPPDPDADAPRMAVGIVDLTAKDAVVAIERAVDAGVPVIAYGPHVDEQTMTAARAAGATAVYPRGRFLMQTAALVHALLETGKDG